MKAPSRYKIEILTESVTDIWGYADGILEEIPQVCVAFVNKPHHDTE